jgi:UDP-N-acetylglucosamine transferase subunit ALG13
MRLEPVDLRELDEATKNVYEAVVVAAKKSRVETDERRMQFNQQLSTLPDVTAEEDGEDLNNPAQLKISEEFEALDKPHVAALKELLAKEIEYEYKEIPSPSFEL